jgi:hypothetical protein
MMTQEIPPVNQPYSMTQNKDVTSSKVKTFVDKVVIYKNGPPVKSNRRETGDRFFAIRFFLARKYQSFNEL